jgi:hypothetical protein
MVSENDLGKENKEIEFKPSKLDDYIDNHMELAQLLNHNYSGCEDINELSHSKLYPYYSTNKSRVPFASVSWL